METIKFKDDIHIPYQSAVSNGPMADPTPPPNSGPLDRCALNFKTINYYYSYYIFFTKKTLKFQ